MLPTVALATDGEANINSNNNSDATSTTTLHKLNYPVDGKCGQADGVPEKAVFFVKTLGGFQDGSCATDGYTVAAGTAQGTGEKDQQRVYAIYGKQ